VITTHVLDIAVGKPAAGVRVRLEALDGEIWKLVGEGSTNHDGRARTLVPADAVLTAGSYRLRFETGEYFAAAGVEGFYPHVEIVFAVRDPAGHHHVPLLLSPYGYSTYRGS